MKHQLRHFEHHHACKNCDLDTVFTITFGRRFDGIVNHDHPHFGDPDSDDEIEGPEECQNCQETFNHADILADAVDGYRLNFGF